MMASIFFMSALPGYDGGARGASRVSRGAQRGELGGRPEPPTSSAGPSCPGEVLARQAGSQVRGVVDRYEPRRLDHGQGTVVDAQAPERVEGRAQQIAGVHADDTAVGDHENLVLAAVGRRAAVEGAPHPGRDAVERLPARRRVVVRGPEPREVGIALLAANLVDRPAFPSPERQLAQLVHRDHRNRGGAERDGRRLPRALHRAHVHRGQAPRAERPAQRLGLGAPALGQADVAATLEAPRRIPVRLPVAREQERHVVRPRATASAWPKALSTRSRPRIARTSKMGGEAVPPVTATRASWARSTSLSPSSAASSLTDASMGPGPKSSSGPSRSPRRRSRSAPSAVKNFAAALASKAAGSSQATSSK